MTTDRSSLGDFLRAEREKRGITIEQVASATKIGMATLHALEADQYRDLPATPFVRGFIIAYCRFIGIDGKEVVSNFSEFLQEHSKERPNKEEGHSGYAFEKKEGVQRSRTFLIVAIFSFIAVGSLALLVVKPALKNKKKSHVALLRQKLGNVEENGPDQNEPSEEPENKDPLSDILSQPKKETSDQSEKPQKTEVVSEEPKKEEPKNAAPTTKVVKQEKESDPKPQEPRVEKVEQDSSSSQEGEQKRQEEKKVASPSSQNEALAQEKKWRAGENPDDPLDSGKSLTQDKIKHKVVFKVNSDVWVRYRSDDRPERRFVIREGGVLVLRAEKAIRFQVNDPNAVSLSYWGRPYQELKESEFFVKDQDESLFIVPGKVALKEGEKPFSSVAPLPEAVPPSRSP